MDIEGECVQYSISQTQRKQVFTVGEHVYIVKSATYEVTKQIGYVLFNGNAMLSLIYLTSCFV